MTEMTATQASIAEEERHRAMKNAVHDVLRQLKECAAAIPDDYDDEMPEHHIEWIVSSARDPATEIVDANERHPVLWWSALPKEVAIVPRELLMHLIKAANLPDSPLGPTKPEEFAEFMHGNGVVLVESMAAKKRYAHYYGEHP